MTALDLTVAGTMLLASPLVLPRGHLYLALGFYFAGMALLWLAYRCRDAGKLIAGNRD